MAQDTTPAIVCYQGNGSNSVFSVPFDKGYYGEVKVLFVRRGLADYIYNPNTYTVSGRLYAWALGPNYIYTHTPNPAVGAHTYNSSDVQQLNDVSAVAGQTITVNSITYTRAVQHDLSNNLLLTWTGTTLQVGDFICIIRDTERGQPYTMPNNQKHIENALDNLERQIQEVKDATDNALKIDPSYNIPDSHKMNPIDWLETIIRSTDKSIRGLHYANGWLDYSLDDPNIADGSKTWHHLLNTDNIKNIREQREIVDGIEHYWVEYLTYDNKWRKLVDSLWEERLEEVEAQAAYAVETSETALQISNNADTKATNAMTYATQALDVVADIYSERFVFTITEGQTTLQFDDTIEDKVVDLYWQGQYITKTGNWSVSGNTISLLFGPETGDTIAVIVGMITKVIDHANLDAHNIDPSAHTNIISTHNSDNYAHSTLFDAKATKVTVRRW